MNRFYCGAVFALAMNHAGHNLIQHVDASVYVTKPPSLDLFRCPDGYERVLRLDSKFSYSVAEAKCAPADTLLVLTRKYWKHLP